jgi:hypothetical protein
MNSRGRLTLICMACIVAGVLAHKGWTEAVRPVLVMMCNAGNGGCK